MLGQKGGRKLGASIGIPGKEAKKRELMNKKGVTQIQGLLGGVCTVSYPSEEG